MQPEAVVFDLDGTLVDSAPDIAAALNIVLGRHGHAAFDIDPVRSMIGGGPELLVRRALGARGTEPDDDAVAALTAEFEQCYLGDIDHRTRLCPGARELLAELAARRIPVGLCSNKPDRLCRASVSALQLGDYFGSIHGSGNGMPTKPDPAMLLAVINELGATTGTALYVGDSAYDVATARAANVDVALVRGGYTATPADRLGADWVLDGLADVPSIWERS